MNYICPLVRRPMNGSSGLLQRSPDGASPRFPALLCWALLLLPGGPARAEAGPATEKRFPPLVLPEGFSATLFACDPLVEYPSVIALGPRQGTVLVAHDYLTGLGIEIVRRDEIRLLADTDGDGYADRSTVFADGFNSIQGLATDGDTVLAMHAPLLTALRDTDGDGRADERHDLLSGLGLPPEQNDNRLHCANGVVVGHDGWLYLALGDRGCDVQRPEGDRLVFQQGGILRCRADGTDLHVFSGGMRNIYDIALDEELNVFVRDNENDGGEFMIRVCHSFHGADHGYPYLYYEQRAEALPPLAELGRGSSAGGVCYLETAFPQEYRGALLFCEWGRAVVRYPLSSSASGFAATQEMDFAAAAANDPYGFKPTDLVVDRDGSVLVSDWADGQRPKRGRGRIYRITWRKAQPAIRPAGLLDQLDSPSYHVRVEAQRAILQSAAAVEELRQVLPQQRLGELGRMHAVWILARVDGERSVEQLCRLAESDPDSRVRAQSVRAIADLTDPLLAQHRLDAGRGSETVALRLARLAEREDRDPRVVREVVVALGRLRWKLAPQWLSNHVKVADPLLAHSAMQTLRRAENWPAVLRLLDFPDNADGNAGKQMPGMHALALRAVARQADAEIVDGLLRRLEGDAEPLRRGEYADVLGRVFKQPGPWKYWGFRPLPRTPNTIAWSRTESIGAALAQALTDPHHQVRASALARMVREEIPVPTDALANWLNDDPESGHAAIILDALGSKPTGEIQPILERFIRAKSASDVNRLTALAMYMDALPAADASRLAALAREIEDGPVLAKLFGELGMRAKVDVNSLLLAKLASGDSAVRAAAITALASRGAREAAPRIAPLLDDDNPAVRRAAAASAGELGAAEAIGRLLQLAKDDEPAVRDASIGALRQLDFPLAVPLAVAALSHPQTQLAGLEYLKEFGSADQREIVIALARTNRSAETMAAAVYALAAWQQRLPALSPQWEELARAIAEIQGDNGAVIRWSVCGPVADGGVSDIEQMLSQASSKHDWRFGSGTEGLVEWKAAAADAVCLAAGSVWVPEQVSVEMLGSGSGAFQMWLNGKSVYRRPSPGEFQLYSDRFDAQLSAGMNRLVVRASASNGVAKWHLRFRAKSSRVEHEQLAAAALANRGSLQRGREVFLNVEKSQCLKCHRLGETGARIGPDLIGLGRRFSRIYVVESILDPGRTIAPSYATMAIALADGRVLSGVKVHETDRTVTLGDSAGKLLEIPRSEIEQSATQPISIMPEGLEKRLTEQEFVDLISYLMSQTSATTSANP